MLDHVLDRGEARSERLTPAIMIALGAALLFFAFFDQGQVLGIFIGNTAYQQNHLHEFFHDGRHLFGIPCH